MVPDDLYVAGKKIHLAWLSGIWINPDYRNKGLGTQLHKAAFETWNGMLLVTEFTAINKKTILGTQYYDNLLEKQGIKLYFKSPFTSYLLAKSAGKWKVRLGTLLDSIINGINSIKNRTVSIPIIKDKWTYIESRDFTEEESNFINQYAFYSSFNRRSNELNWIIKYPWIGNDQNSLQESKRYYFSVYSPQFENKFLKVYHEGILRAVIFITIRNGVAKIPYIFADDEDMDIVSRSLMNYFSKIHISILISYHYDWKRSILKYSKKRCFYKNTMRTYLGTKDLIHLIDKSSVVIETGDGDNIFV